MATNRDLDATWTYHNATKHSYSSVRTSQHSLDWDNRPLPFKIYPSLEPLTLSRELPQTGMAALSVISEVATSAEADAVPDLKNLAQILYFSAGITKRRAYPGGEVFYRAASCTGALYEIELYLIAGDLPGLEAGVYHFSAADFSLRKLRAGDYRGVLIQATGGDPGVSHAPVTVVSTGTYWRNAWKYQARTYRHFGWDNGTLLANLLAICAALRFPVRVVCGFVDHAVNELLGLDPSREVALSFAPVGYIFGPSPLPPMKIPPLTLETVLLSKREMDYPAMRAMHEASSLRGEKEVAAWRAGTLLQESPAPKGKCILLRPHPDEEVPRDTIEQVILRRGSTRKFARQPISFVQLSTMLDRASRGVPADFLDPSGTLLNDIYLIAHAVEGLNPGAYVLHRRLGLLECLEEGDFRKEAYYLGLEQELPADASVDVFFLSDLRPILDCFGNRGYRALQLEAGILGGKLYLAAYAQRLSATGLTFYDDDVTNFFSPHAKSKSAIFLVALGRSPQRQKP